MRAVTYSPSVMSGDLANIEGTIRSLEEIGIDTLHVDILDGRFSPSMPIGLETARRIREVTDLTLDAHIMTVDNEFFVRQMIDLGMDSITFHHETTLHVDRLITLVKRAGKRVGIGLNPATSLSVLEYVLPEVDSVCVMLINPGYATDAAETQVPYALTKVRRLRQLIAGQGLDVGIQVDGRVSLEAIPGLVAAGATNLVLGSTSLFGKGRTLQENKRLLDEAVARAHTMEGLDHE